MSARVEAFLARLYVDDGLWSRFVVDAESVTARAGLSEGERQAIVAMDRVGLELARESFRRKREHARRRRAANKG